MTSKKELTKLVAQTQRLRREMMFGAGSKHGETEVHPLTVLHLMLASASLDAVLGNLEIARLYLPTKPMAKGRRR